MSGTKSRLRLSMHFGDVAWDSVRDSLKVEMKLSETEAGRLIRNFIRKLTSPVNAQWLGKRALSGDEHKVVLALCEIHGADVLTLNHERVFSVPLMEIRYLAEIEFDPFVRTDGTAERSGTVSGRYSIRFPGTTVHLSRIRHAVAFYGVLMIAGVFLYVLLAGMLFYALAVFLLFLADPEMMTVVATKEPSIGLALLCFLVAVAGLGGRAFRNIAALLRSRRFARVGSTLS